MTPSRVFWLSAVFCLILISCFCGRALAGVAEDKHRDDLRRDTLDMNNARKALESKDRSQWTDQEAEAYLFYALYVVEDAIRLYNDEHKQIPYSASEIRDTDLVSDWPGNPFQNWEPIQVSDYPSDFSAGNMVLRSCPPELYSGVKHPVARTHALYVFGQDKSYKPINPVSALFDWVTIQEGTLFLTGQRFQTTAETLTKIAERDALLRQDQAEGHPK